MPRGRDDIGNPLHGNLEMTSEDVEALARVFDEPVNAFWPTLEAKPDGDEAGLDAAHAWLSANATGPWRWHDRTLAMLYVERDSDREAFLAVHGALFTCNPAHDRDVGRVAVLRGVLPPLTAKESFSVWLRENAGFRFVQDGDLARKGLYRIVFDHPAPEMAFVADHEGAFTYVGEAYVLPQDARTGDGVPLPVWCDRHSGVGEVRAHGTTEGGRCTLLARYSDVAEALERDWGHVFRATPGAPGRYEGPYLPEDPRRELPADFAAYLRGEVDTYEAPHLPEGIQGPGAHSSGPST